MKVNAKKTKTMVFNISEPVNIYINDGSKLEIAQDFNYLGSHTESSDTDIKAREASAWKACIKLRKIGNKPSADHSRSVCSWPSLDPNCAESECKLAESHHQ